MPRGLTWPNDPETYYSNARVYRIVFGPAYFVSAQAGAAAPTPVPITPSEPVGLCSALPPQYGYDANKANCAGEIDNGAVFAGAALAPSCTTLEDPACKIGDVQYDCYLPLGKCATWECALTGLGGPAHAAPPGLTNVLCRWSAPTPSPAPTIGGVPTPTAAPTPAPVTITSPAAGSTVKGVVTFSCSNPGGSTNLYVDDVFLAHSSYSWDTTQVANGSHHLLCNGYRNGTLNGSKSEKVTVSN